MGGHSGGSLLRHLRRWDAPPERRRPLRRVRGVAHRPHRACACGAGAICVATCHHKCAVRYEANLNCGGAVGRACRASCSRRLCMRAAQCHQGNGGARRRVARRPAELLEHVHERGSGLGREAHAGK